MFDSRHAIRPRPCAKARRLADAAALSGWITARSADDANGAGYFRVKRPAGSNGYTANATYRPRQRKRLSPQERAFEKRPCRKQRETIPALINHYRRWHRCPNT